MQTYGSCHSGVKATWTIHFVQPLSIPWNHRQTIRF